MAQISSIFMIYLIVTTSGVAFAAVYYFIYKSYVNKKIKEPSKAKRRLPSPLSFLIITIVSACVLFGILLCVSTIINKTDNAITPNCNFREVESGKEEEYGNAYSIEQNDGYDKKVETVGDIRFTYFISKSAYDTYHPSFIIFAEYTGKESILQNGVNGTFYYTDDKLIGGYGFSGGQGKNTVCLIGDANMDCIFELTVAFYDTKVKSENIQDGATACEVLRFAVSD